MNKSDQTDKQRLLKKLAAAADEARSVVSGYTDEQRQELELQARGIVRRGTPATCVT